MKATVIGRRYSEIPTYPSWDADKEFPHFELLYERTWEIDVETVHDGEKWLAENHPKYYMGGSIVCENGDFACLAVPCCEYGKGNYETVAARVACVEKIAAKMIFDEWRLTKWNGAKWTLPQGRTSDGESYWRLIADRLAAYENTGLTPKAIEALKGRENSR